jgi:hypothetical protein
MVGQSSGQQGQKKVNPEETRGKLRETQVAWTNYIWTDGNDNPMRGFHVATSHWKFTDKVF